MNSKKKDTKRIRGTSPEIEEAARELRYNMTHAEEILWNKLKGKKLGGFKFRSQHPVGQFILDFYCPECKLVVELDGGVHDDQKEYDQTRDEHLQDFGYQVLRFPNQAVINRLPDVLRKICNMAQFLSQQQ